MTLVTGRLAPPKPDVPIGLLQAAHTAWRRYADSVRMRAPADQRALTYQLARQAEHKIWVAENAGAART